MTSRTCATMLGLLLAGGIVLTTSGATIGAVEAEPRHPDAVTASTDRSTTAETEGGAPFLVSRHTETYPLGAGQEFDRGVWCTFKQVQVYDKYHDETYYIDRKVCLGTIER